MSRQVCELSTQGVALVLDSFKGAQFQLTHTSLERMAGVIQRKILLFTSSELAISLQALSAQGFKPSSDFVQVRT